MPKVYEEDFLEHYGVKGMHWGIRKDDRRTTGMQSRNSRKKAGPITNRINQARSNSRARKRFQANHVEPESLKKAKRQVALETHNPKELSRYKNYLNDNELRQRYNRLQLERSVDQMNGAGSWKEDLNTVMNSPQARAATEVGKAALTVIAVAGAKKYVEKKGWGSSKQG